MSHRNLFLIFGNIQTCYLVPAVQALLQLCCHANTVDRTNAQRFTADQIVKTVLPPCTRSTLLVSLCRRQPHVPMEETVGGLQPIILDAGHSLPLI